MQVREESCEAVACEAERRETTESRRKGGGAVEGASVTLAVPPREDSEKAGKDRDSKSEDAGTQVMVKVSVKDGGTGSVKRASTAEKGG